MDAALELIPGMSAQLKTLVEGGFSMDDQFQMVPDLNGRDNIRITSLQGQIGPRLIDAAPTVVAHNPAGDTLLLSQIETLGNYLSGAA